MKHSFGCRIALGATIDDLLDARDAFRPRCKGSKVLVDNKHPGFTITQDKIDFRRSEASIEGHDDRPHASAGIVEFEVAVAIEHEDRQPLAAPYSQVRQPTYQAIGAIGKLAPGILALSTGDGWKVPGYFYDVFKSLSDIHLHVPFMENNSKAIAVSLTVALLDM